MEITKKTTSVRCRKCLRRKALDKYKVQKPRLVSVYASAHGPGSFPSWSTDTLPPVNFVSNTHFHVHTYTFFQHLHFPQHAHNKLFLNLEEAQVTNTLVPTDFSQGSLKNCQADSSSLCPWLGSSAPTIIIRLHFQQSRSPLSGAAPA